MILMTIQQTSFQITEDRIVGLRIRPDLSCDRQTQQGQVWWVIKDPLSLNYFRLRDEQYFVLKSLDAKTSLKNNS